MNKINRLLRSWPSQAVYLTAWLQKQGYSTQLLNKYKKSKWIVPLGNGAMLRAGDTPSVAGALYAMQKQAQLTVHPGANTALQLAGRAHYLALDQNEYILFSEAGESLPSWMKKYNWKEEIVHISSSFLPKDIGIVEHEISGLSIRISKPARALLECLYLVPKKQDLEVCYHIMEGLNNLRPVVVQQLLEACTSIKVKRLFLYLATKANHHWVSHLNLNQIDLGKGKRKIVDHGVYVPAFKITVPKTLEDGTL